MPEVILRPRRTTVLDFLPYATFARVNLDYYEDEGTHSDTGYRIEEGPTSTIIVDATLGLAARNFTINALNLILGEVYSLRVRRKNETDWGPWSHRIRKIVHTELELPPNTVLGEPLNAAAQPLPTQPDFIGEASIARDLINHPMQTRHRWRRLKHTSSRWSARMKWVGLSTAEKTTLVSFLEARLDAIEPFETSDIVHGSRKWWARRGTIQFEQLAPAMYGVQIEADQSKPVQFWTVGVSEVEGPDPIL